MTITLVGHTYENCYLKRGQYSNGRIALILMDEDGLVVCKPSVNLPNEDCEDGHCYIKDYSENEGIYNQFVRLEIVSIAIRYGSGGYAGLPYVKILV